MIYLYIFILLQYLYLLFRLLTTRRLILIFKIFLLISILPGFPLILSLFFDLYPHYLGFFIQTPTVIFISSLIPLTGTYISYIVLKKFSYSHNLIYSLNTYKTKAVFFSFISLCFSVLYGSRLGFAALSGSYGSAELFTTGVDGVLGLLQNFFASYVFIYLFNQRLSVTSTSLNLSLTLFLSYLIPILAGSRADYLIGFILSCYLLLSFIFRIISARKFFYPVTVFRPKSPVLLILVLLAFHLIFAFARALAEWRFGISDSFMTSFIGFLTNPISTILVDFDGHVVIFTETMNHVTGSLMSFVYKINILQEDHILGLSYIHYLPRLLPSFLRSDNLLILENETSINEIVITQGGNYMFAEAFYNFGFLGVVLIALFTSILIGYILKSCRSRPIFSLLSMTIFLESFRIIWYQYFALFRILSVFALFYLLLSLKLRYRTS